MSTSTSPPPVPTPPDPASGPRRRRRPALIAAVLVLVLAGLTLVGLGLVDDRSALPAPAAVPLSAPAAGAVGPAAAPAPGAATGAAPAPGAAAAPRPASPPVSIDIPSIDVRSEVNPVGLDADGGVEVPAPGPLYDEAAWYRYSVTPGETGPSVLLGHVDSAAQGPSVFYDLDRMATRQTFAVTREDGSVLTFQVDSVQRYPKDAFPTEVVYGGTVRPEIRLVTCGGPFDRLERSYEDNVVVFAHLI